VRRARGLRLVLVLTLLPLAFVFLRESLAVDGCLDSGGSYDYQHGRCDLTRSHTYEPFLDRHAVLLGATAVALAGAATAVLLRRRALRRTGI
jgi:hypothetical protein